MKSDSMIIFAFKTDLRMTWKMSRWKRRENWWLRRWKRTRRRRRRFIL